MLVAAALALAALARTACCSKGMPELLRHTYWGEGFEFKSAALGPEEDNPSQLPVLGWRKPTKAFSLILCSRLRWAVSPIFSR